MNTLQKSFEKFINKEQLFAPSDRLLVALSGGVDSIVLVHLLHTAGYQLAIAHCNFQLRGQASNEDADFVTGFANEYGLVLHLKAFDTQAFAAEKKLSTQVAARALRYEWFDKLMQEHGYTHLLTAHHANDQVETMLYNLSKGTGIAGLRGIPLKHDSLRRPLLGTERKDIEAYAKSHQLTWREDASNLERKYSRNRLRLHVIPELKQINPGLEQTMLQNSRRFEALEKLLQHTVQSINSQYLSEANDCHTLALNWYEETQGGIAILIEILKPFGFNANQCFSISESIATRSIGKQYLSAKYTLALDRNGLLIAPQEDTLFNESVTIENPKVSTPYANFTLTTVEVSNNWPKDKNTACLDADLVQFPLKIRNWKQGDSFYPLGMKGKKKLSDFMIDEKIPVNLKLRVALFESGNDIIWVAGHRIDERYKITSKTKRILIIKMTSHV
ncbi:tRNA lysidine(34) synthetase TilS [Reichenbachiella carrageenanivorans]|uniref:tRNA(Ile)-lysidine synthase n=1 Tax=Reichenbachiella carrageenanivorans TaxID=2979869 RepID=A0ABY6CZY4_9BACT|nr:tRNA lysidine(34) synthetase TilS [Reichenbachiella carrageenanivorans]UXX79254.1 tRNA lysidine(34) synthetase TilS [Reichenbachiella carrageenanivorans]